jgi:hypothetical protein
LLRLGHRVTIRILSTDDTAATIEIDLRTLAWLLRREPGAGARKAQARRAAYARWHSASKVDAPSIKSRPDAEKCSEHPAYDRLIDRLIVGSPPLQKDEAKELLLEVGFRASWGWSVLEQICPIDSKHFSAFLDATKATMALAKRPNAKYLVRAFKTLQAPISAVSGHSPSVRVAMLPGERTKPDAGIRQQLEKIGIKLDFDDSVEGHNKYA